MHKLSYCKSAIDWAAADNPQRCADCLALPVRVDRRFGARLVSKRFFRVSHRTLEKWPLTWVLVNGHAHCDTAELFAVAQGKLDAALRIRGGRRSS